MTSLKAAAQNKRSPKEQKDDKTRIKELEKLVSEQQDRIGRLNKAKYTIQKPRKSRGKGSHLRVIMPDTHGCQADPAALSAFFHDLEYLQPKEIVHIGDLMECGGLLAAHHTLAYVAQCEYTFEDDCHATNTILDRIQASSPKSIVHYLAGNHERRIETFCIDLAVKSKCDAAFFHDMFSVESVLSLESRGINYYSQGKHYMDLRVPATIRLGNCVFTHGTRAGVHACKLTLQDFGCSVVFGHTHRLGHFNTTTLDNDIGAWNVGCLSQIQPLWRHTAPTGWSHGYGLQMVQPNGDFLHVNIPIIGGRSLLKPLAERLKV